jgi:hypothetical protein
MRNAGVNAKHESVRKALDAAILRDIDAMRAVVEAEWRSPSRKHDEWWYYTCVSTHTAHLTDLPDKERTEFLNSLHPANKAKTTAGALE